MDLLPVLFFCCGVGATAVAIVWAYLTACEAEISRCPDPRHESNAPISNPRRLE